MREQLRKEELMLADFYHRFAMLHQILDLGFHTLSVDIIMELCFLFFRETSHVWKHNEKDAVFKLKNRIFCV